VKARTGELGRQLRFWIVVIQGRTMKRSQRTGSMAFVSGLFTALFAGDIVARDRCR
jgi:hypothetical protein